jgi:hypothetical protein
MYLEPKETARLYKLLSDKLGNDTTEAMFKYIDNKTERTVEATIKTLATKDDLKEIRNEMVEMRLATKDDFKEIRNDMADMRLELRNEIANVKYDLSKEISASIKWMFIFWIGQIGAMLAILFLFLKK